jgi:chromate transporter
MQVLIELFWNFTCIALLGFGNATATIPEIEKLVTLHGWMDHKSYAEIYALGQLVPGSNLLHIILIGNKVAGLPGAIAAGMGMFLPTSLLVYGLARFLKSSHDNSFLKHFNRVLDPITIGVLFATGWNLSQGVFNHLFLVAVCCLTILLTTKRLLSSAWIVLLAASVGALQAYLFSPPI